MHKLSLVAAMGVVAVMARAHAAPLEISNQPEAASLNAGDMLPMVRLQNGTPTLYQIPPSLLRQGLAPLDSPSLTGTPTAPTAAAGSNSTQVGTTAYTDAAVGVVKSLAAAAQATADAAMPTATYTDGSGNVTAPIQNKSVTIMDSLVPSFGGLKFEFPSQYGSAYGNPYEMRILSNAPLNNPIRLENDYPTGLAAFSFAGWDSALGLVHEHMAVGYGAGLPNGADRDYNYIENSCYQTDSSGNGLNSTTCPGADFIIQETGAAYIGVPNQVYAEFTGGSTSATLYGGATWPDGINGQLLDTPVAYGMLVPGTTVVSGAGTATIVMSKPANANTGEATGTLTRIGPTEYSQHDSFVFKHMGNIDVFAFICAKWGGYSCGPFLSLDRIRSRVGINNPNPAAPLDVKGQIVGNVSGSDTSESYGVQGAINAQVLPGTPANEAFHVYGVGTNQLRVYWNLNPSRLDWVDANASVVPLSLHMDGTADVDIGGTLTVAGGETVTGVATLKGGAVIPDAAAAPASSDACTAGTTEFVGNYMYRCISSGNWGRVEMTTGY